MCYLFLTDCSPVRVKVVAKVDGVDGRARPLVQGGLLADPEVDVPIQSSSRVHEGVKDDVAIALVKLSVTRFVNL